MRARCFKEVPHDRKNEGSRSQAHFVMILIALCSVAPFILLLMSSITDDKALITYGYFFFPRVFSVEAYRYLLSDSNSIFRAHGISIFITEVGTLCNLTLTTLYAYPLSHKELPGRNIFAFVLFFTMLFYGRLVPSYIRPLAKLSNRVKIADTSD